MKQNVSKPSRDEVLDAFAVEATLNPEMLADYCKNYPEYANDLGLLWRELSQPQTQISGPLSTRDEELINSAWTRYQTATKPALVDPFASLTIPMLREIASALGITRGILAAFRDRKVIQTSVPQPFLARLASAMKTSTEGLREYLGIPPTRAVAVSHKAEGKPEESKPVSFEQLLIEANISADDRTKLMSRD